MDIWNDTQIYVRASCTRHTKKYVATKQTSVLNKAGALWIKRLKHTLVIFDGKGNSSSCYTKDENNHRKIRPEVVDVFIICGLEVHLLLILFIIMTQKKNTFVGLQIA